MKSFGQGKPAQTTLGDIDRYLILRYCHVTPSVTTMLNIAISYLKFQLISVMLLTESYTKVISFKFIKLAKGSLHEFHMY